MKKEKLRDSLPALETKSFLDGNGASVKGFFDFCKQNTPLVISVALAVLFVYGIILFNITLTGDTILYTVGTKEMNGPVFTELGYYNIRMDCLSLGRWTQVLLSDLFFIKESGIYASNFIGIVSVWIFSMLFSYFIAVFTRNTNRRNGLIPLALILLTYSVWGMYFLNIYGNKIQTLFISLTLISVYLLYDGLFSKNKIKLFTSFVLAVFSFGVYQSFIILFPCIVFIFFVLLQENSNLSSKEYSFLCLKLFVFLIAALIFNTIVANIFKSILNVPRNSYATGTMIWHKTNIRSIFANILGLGYLITIGLIPFIHSLFMPIMESMYGSSLAPYGGSITDNILLYSRTIGNVLLLPAGIMFLVMIFINAKNRIPKGRRLLYVLAGIGIPVSTLFTVIASGEIRGVRVLYTLPFAAAFVFYYVSYTQKTVLRRIFYCLILSTAFYQAQVSQGMLEGAVRTSEFDMNTAFDISALIREADKNDNAPKVAFIGNMRHFKNQIFPAFDITARSPFERWSLGDMPYPTNIASMYMATLGFNYDIPTPEQIQEAYEASRDMPAYPAKGCVKNLGDVIVVKMGE
jgi:hypothetical protein